MARRKMMGRNARLLISLLAGVATVVMVGNSGAWDLAFLVGWNVFAGLLILLIFLDFTGHRGEQTAKVAKREDMQESLLDAMVIISAIASIGGVFQLMASKNSIEHLVIAIVTVIISWTVVQVLFTLRYAALYYGDKPGGIDFNGDDSPEFADFAYLAFTLGMTYQVSDTNISSKIIRRAVLQRSLISFMFGVLIIATTINLLAGLLQS